MLKSRENRLHALCGPLTQPQMEYTFGWATRRVGTNVSWRFVGETGSRRLLQNVPQLNSY